MQVTVTARDRAENEAATTASATVGAPAGVLPVSHWKAEFDAVRADAEAYSMRLATSGDALHQYRLGYSTDAFLAMYEATGDESYASTALGFAEASIAQAAPSTTFPKGYGDQFEGWVVKTTGYDPGAEVPLYESYHWRYVVRALHVLRDTSLEARRAAVQAWAEVNIFDKWTSRGMSNIYRSNTHMASHWAYISRHLAEITANSARRSAAQAIAANIDHAGMSSWDGASLRGQLHLWPDGGYWWNDEWGEHSTPGQDVDHGNNVISYVVAACDLGQEWTPTDMGRFAVTLSRIMPLATYLDGTGSAGGWLHEGFAKLGRFSADAQRALQDHTEELDFDPQQFFGAMAVGARRLGATD